MIDIHCHILPGIDDGAESAAVACKLARRAVERGVKTIVATPHCNLCSAFFTVQLSHPYMTTGKTIALTRQTFVGKGMSLLFNMLSRLVITFLPINH